MCRPVQQFGYSHFREQIGAVLQDDHLFTGSIADNIARMLMGYETLVGDMGSSLTGGQKQRVLLARALYRRPSLLVMDEGTSHLDSEVEMRVLALLGQLPVTRIVIAHRSAAIEQANTKNLGRGGGGAACLRRDARCGGRHGASNLRRNRGASYGETS